MRITYVAGAGAGGGGGGCGGYIRERERERREKRVRGSYEKGRQRVTLIHAYAHS